MDTRNRSALSRAALIVAADGTVEALPAAQRLLEFAPADLPSLEARIEVVTPSGSVLSGGALPWNRADDFEEVQLWRDRFIPRSFLVTVRGWHDHEGARMVLGLERRRSADSDRQTRDFLSALNESLLGSGPELPMRDILRMLLGLACELTDATYGAMGVLDHEGKRLRDFLYTGVTEEQARRIGNLPEGKGVLGALIREPQPIRLARIDADPRSAGFPPHHPHMTAFLGVPIRIRERIFGNFYLADKRNAVEFSDEDERRLTLFSAQAALTIAVVEQFEEQEHRLFQALIEHAPYGITFFPTDPRETAVGNQAAHRLLGSLVPAGDPDAPFQLSTPGGRILQPHELPAARALRGESVLNEELTISRLGRLPVFVLVSAAEVRSDAGHTLGVVVIYQDITPMKELQRLRDEFAATVAHDMRTPVQAVMLQVEKFLQNATGAAAWVPIKALENMRRNSQRLNRLIGDLLDASRIDTHRLPLDLRTVHVPEMVQSVVEQLAGVLAGREIIITVDNPPPPAVSADPTRLEQLLANLLENANKYSTAKMPIHVTIRGEGNGASISIRDHGPGIPSTDIPHLFERYYRGSSARSGRTGLGLGLYICRGIAEAHGGRVDAVSEPGCGATFRVWLPPAGS